MRQYERLDTRPTARGRIGDVEEDLENAVEPEGTREKEGEEKEERIYGKSSRKYGKIARDVKKEKKKKIESTENHLYKVFRAI